MTDISVTVPLCSSAVWAASHAVACCSEQPQRQIVALNGIRLVEQILSVDAPRHVGDAFEDHCILGVCCVLSVVCCLLLVVVCCLLLGDTVVHRNTSSRQKKQSSITQSHNRSRFRWRCDKKAYVIRVAIQSPLRLYPPLRWAWATLVVDTSNPSSLHLTPAVRYHA